MSKFLEDENTTLIANVKFLLESQGEKLKGGSFSLKKELIIGVEYDVLSFKNKSDNFEFIVDVNNNEIISGKEIFIEKKATQSFIKVAILPYLFFDVILYTSLKIKNPREAILIFLPMMYGYIIYAMAYAEAKDYLKKATDTITFFSGLLTACLVLVKDVSLTALLNSGTQPLSFRIILFLLMQTFAIFATIKFFISLNETFVERKKYIESLPKCKEGKKGRWVIVFVKFKTKYVSFVRTIRKKMLYLVNLIANRFVRMKKTLILNIKKISQLFHKKA